MGGQLVKVSTDSIIAAILHPSLHLTGDEDGGVGLHCRDHFDGGRPLAHYERTGSDYPDPLVARVASIPSLWAEAVKHLEASHKSEARS
jgi:hypothetical protein